LQSCMTLPRWPQNPVRSPPFLESGTQRLMVFRGYCPISTQRIRYTARHITSVRSVCPDAHFVWGVRSLERGYRAWYVRLPGIKPEPHLLSGDKSNHVPSFHIPQLYYFIAFATMMGWPALVSGDGGWKMLVHQVQNRVLGSRRSVLVANACCENLNLSPLTRRMMVHAAVSVAMGLSIKAFT
jgi:DIE2/ALG10 family